MNVPFVDLKIQYQKIKNEIDNAIANVINETAFIGGKYVDEFEQNFAEKYGVNHCVSVANGTDSLYIIMKMLNIGPGDEVITVVNSWISSSETITQTGARPVFVDIDPEYYSINEELIESKITERTKAIIPVHLQGQVCEMNKIKLLAKKYNLYIIEDCAQSHFSKFGNDLAGTMGTASSFSFYPGKNLGAYGDAGCILTNDIDLANRCRMFARHGALIKHKHIIEGVNSRLDGLQAAVLNVKLKYISEWTSMRINNAKLYHDLLENVSEVQTPKVRPDSTHTYHLYVVRTKLRGELMAYLKNNGIETAIHYPTALHNLEAYKYLRYNPLDFPVANTYQDEILSLPMFPELTGTQIEYVVNKIKEYFVHK